MGLRAKQVIVGILGLFLLASLFLVAWVEGGKQRFETRLPSVAVGKNLQCVKCHRTVSPAIVAQWEGSVHAQKAVGCLECHDASKDDIGAFLHKGSWITTYVTPRRCGECHVQEEKEFMESPHARAASFSNDPDLALLQRIEGKAAFSSGLGQRHGSVLQFLKDSRGKILRDKSGEPFFDPDTWPNAGIARVNPDGSIGNCAMCHLRHAFSIAEARQPETCMNCHAGPLDPSDAVFNQSLHGIAYRAHVHEMNFASDKWIAGADYSAAPSCATCHMSATPSQRVTHNVADRMSQALLPVVSHKTEGWEDKRNNMTDVCEQCHDSTTVDNFYKQFDSAVELWDDRYSKPAKAIMRKLKEKGKLSKAPFSQPIQWTFFKLTRMIGRNARIGASMQGIQVTQWNGFYEGARCFRTEFIPEAEKLAAGDPELLKFIRDTSQSAAPR